MTREAKLNAVAVCFLAALFYWLFMFAKHSPYLSELIPFGDDPYDSVGSFACVVGALLAFVALVRAFYPPPSAPDSKQMLYLVRSQLAVVLALLLTAAADATAMVRYPQQWYPSFWGAAVMAVVAVMAIAAWGVFLLLRSSLPAKTKVWRKSMVRALMATFASMVLLAACPKSMLNDMALHLFVIVLGAVALFAPLRLWLDALAPEGGFDDRAEWPTHKSSVWRRWAGVFVLGAVVGVCAFAGELAGHSAALPMRRLLFVGSIFTGIGLSGIVLAYLFLGKPLGFRS